MTNGDNKEVKSKKKFGNAQRDDYADLVNKIEENCKNTVDSFQESGPREIKLVHVYCDSRSGLACGTDEQGIPQLKNSREEPGAQKKKVRQRFFMGLEAGADTKGRAIKTVPLKKKGRAPKPSQVSPGADYPLLETTIQVAQDEGDKVQRKIDDENYEWFSIHIAPAEENTVAEDIEPDPDVGMIMDLVAFTRGEVADKLGAKAEEISVEFVKITEHMLYADSNGSKTDSVYPRISFVIAVKTKGGNNAYGTIRGSGGTIKEILARYVTSENPEEKEPKTVVNKLIDEVVKEAIDLDRASTTTVIGASECPVILSSRVVGVLAHEVYGHTAEADIICENRRKKDAGVQLKSRVGAQVSDNQNLTIIDTPEKEFKLGEVVIKYAWGALPVDGYGNAGKTATIVEKGTMVGALVDRHTLNEIISGLKDPNRLKEVGVTGNVRREKFDHPPLIRMRNTFILPDENGPSSRADMAKLIPANKKGIYIRSCHGGSVSPDSGDFKINANLCYLIENGVITDKPIKNVVITGNIKQISFIKAIGNSKVIRPTFTGWCGKNGQMVPVEGGGPLLYIESARLAGGSLRDWDDIVKDYLKQHQEAKEGKRGKESIDLPEFREIVPDGQSQEWVCLLTMVLPGGELRYLLGTGDYSTHEIDENGKLIEKRDSYE